MQITKSNIGRIPDREKWEWMAWTFPEKKSPKQSTKSNILRVALSVNINDGRFHQKTTFRPLRGGGEGWTGYPIGILSHCDYLPTTRTPSATALLRIEPSQLPGRQYLSISPISAESVPVQRLQNNRCCSSQKWIGYCDRIFNIVLIRLNFLALKFNA